MDYKNKVPMVSRNKQALIIRTRNNRLYGFECKNQVCLAWVRAEDVDYVKNYRVGCCGRKKLNFYEATDEEVSKWLS